MPNHEKIGYFLYPWSGGWNNLLLWWQKYWWLCAKQNVLKTKPVLTCSRKLLNCLSPLSSPPIIIIEVKGIFSTNPRSSNEGIPKSESNQSEKGVVHFAKCCASQHSTGGGGLPRDEKTFRNSFKLIGILPPLSSMYLM